MSHVLHLVIARDQFDYTAFWLPGISLIMITLLFTVYDTHLAFCHSISRFTFASSWDWNIRSCYKQERLWVATSSCSPEDSVDYIQLSSTGLILHLIDEKVNEVHVERVLRFWHVESEVGLKFPGGLRMFRGWSAKSRCRNLPSTTRASPVTGAVKPPRLLHNIVISWPKNSSIMIMHTVKPEN